MCKTLPQAGYSRDKILGLTSRSDENTIAQGSLLYYRLVNMCIIQAKKIISKTTLHCRDACRVSTKSSSGSQPLFQLLSAQKAQERGGYIEILKSNPMEPHGQRHLFHRKPFVSPTLSPNGAPANFLTFRNPRGRFTNFDGNVPTTTFPTNGRCSLFAQGI